MIKARNSAVLSVSDLVSLNYSAQQADWDLFEEKGILQRDVKSSHRDNFTQLALKNHSENPDITVFDTPLVCRLTAKTRQEDKLVKALKAGKEFKQYVDNCYMIDGQHRAEGLIKLPIEKFDDIKFDVNFVVCNDMDAEGMFFAINGKARKMSPAAVDLSIAHQLVNGAKLETTDTVRGVASMLVKILTELDDHPYAGRIEQPFARPPIKSPRLRFHRTVNNCRWLARSYTTDMGIEPEVYFSSMEFRFSITAQAQMLADAWRAIGIVLDDRIFGRESAYGNVSGPEAWAHSHLFGILNESIVQYAFQTFNKDVGLRFDVLALANFMAPALNAFFDDAEKENEVNIVAGFRGVGGDSPDAKYVERMNTYLHLCKIPGTQKEVSLSEPKKTLAELSAQYEEGTQ